MAPEATIGSTEDKRDTIAAVATGAGRAGIGVVRVSGSDVPNLVKEITGQDLAPREAVYLPFLDAEGNTIDQGIALRFESPHSYTGEHVLELQGHGGPVVLDLLLKRVLSLGARLAHPGEFSERAFLNDKLDLAQAEAVIDLINSSSEAAARAAVRSMSGEFSSDIDVIKEELIGLRVWLEAALDFSEEEIDFLGTPELRDRTTRLISDFDALLARASQGQRLRDGLTIVLAGVANAGKSSLLNALAGTDTAIVTDIAGTTRDVLREDISLDGVPLRIVDTAGLRASDDPVEQLGIERARKAMQQADHVLVILDAHKPEMPDEPLPEDVPVTCLINKVDLVDKAALSSILTEYNATLAVSAKTGESLDNLRSYLLSLAGHDSAIEGVYIARRRHLDALHEARAATDAALLRLTEGNMPELAAEELRLAQSSLDIVTGRFDTEDLLGRIFSDFCVGK